MFGGELKNGFFIEAGSSDSEKFSDTLYFEINHGWTGLLGTLIGLENMMNMTEHYGDVNRTLLLAT